VVLVVPIDGSNYGRLHLATHTKYSNDDGTANASSYPKRSVLVRDVGNLGWEARHNMPWGMGHWGGGFGLSAFGGLGLGSFGFRFPFYGGLGGYGSRFFGGYGGYGRLGYRWY